MSAEVQSGFFSLFWIASIPHQPCFPIGFHNSVLLRTSTRAHIHLPLDTALISHHPSPSFSEPIVPTTPSPVLPLQLFSLNQRIACAFLHLKRLKHRGFLHTRLRPCGASHNQTRKLGAISILIRTGAAACEATHQ